MSDEVRRLEFEFSVPQQSRGGSLRAYALYYVCEEINGSCLYRRQDLTLEVPLASPGDSR